MHESNQQAKFESGELVIRDANSDDISVLRELFEKSRIEGLIRENDTGADLEFLMASYLECKDSGFWVAQHDDGIIGMIGVQRVSENSAEIRRLRVRDSFRCKEKQFLKVVLDVRVERSPAITLFDSFGFSHVRENTSGGRTTIDFYLDLYSDKTDTLH